MRSFKDTGMNSVAGLKEHSNHHGRYFFSPDMHGSFVVGGLAQAIGDGKQKLQIHLEADSASKNTTNFAGGEAQRWLPGSAMPYRMMAFPSL